MKDCIKFIATIVTGLKKTTFLHLCTFRQVCTLHMKADEFKAQIRTFHQLCTNSQHSVRNVSIISHKFIC